MGLSVAAQGLRPLRLRKHLCPRENQRLLLQQELARMKVAGLTHISDETRSEMAAAQQRRRARERGAAKAPSATPTDSALADLPVKKTEPPARRMLNVSPLAGLISVGPVVVAPRSSPAVDRISRLDAGRNESANQVVDASLNALIREFGLRQRENGVAH